MTVSIVEVIGRSSQGKTEPFICRGDDGEIYYVKGRYAGRESQIKELICGGLAVELGLPIAPFEIVDVPATLIESGLGFNLRSLGAGPAFGSRRCAQATEINFAQLRRVPRRTAQDVLLFDWWVRNADRNLTELGGNPNLLWDQNADRLVMIDHNLAFDVAFDSVTFRELHVFHAHMALVFEDLVERATYEKRLKKALTRFPAICDTIPEEWLEEAPAWLDLQAIETELRRCADPGFWNVDR
jgi:hypothetical protein